MKFSIAVCTWNRARLLDHTLSQIEHIRVPPGVEWEIIVVNNNSVDDTQDVLAAHRDRLPLVSLFEPHLGHSRSRNRAVAAAKGELIIWTDDDVLVDQDWAAEYLKAASAWPGAMFFGGPIEPSYTVEPPAWVVSNIDLLSTPFGLRQLGNFVGPFPDQQKPFGANMALRRSVFDEISFHSDLGRHGGDLMMADETYVFDRLLASGHTGVWVGTARVQHMIPADRMTARYIRGWTRANVRSSVRARELLVGSAAGRRGPSLYLTYLERLLRFWVKLGRRDRGWLIALALLGDIEGRLARRGVRARLRRVAGAVRTRARTFRYRGNAVHCPVCDHSFRRFKDDWNRPDALCWHCGSHERHRAQWLLLAHLRPGLLRDAHSLLHFAPEWCLRQRLKEQRQLRYVTADVNPEADTDLHLDITALELPNDSFDAVLCSHVLEHVEGDARAMRELRRITAPGSFALVMVPIALDRQVTYEDRLITDPADREREFLQHDHVRLYAPDIADRLRAAGFAVEVIDLHAELGRAEAMRHGLLASDLIFLCRPET